MKKTQLEIKKNNRNSSGHTTTRIGNIDFVVRAFFQDNGKSLEESLERLILHKSKEKTA